MNNKRLLELCIKKSFEVENIKFEGSLCEFRTSYRIGKGKVTEKLIDAEGDFEIVKITWPIITSKEQEELDDLISKKKKNNNN